MMSKTSTALLIKFIMTFAFAWIAFRLIDGNAFGQIVLLSIIATAVNYIAGDLIVLPKFGNIVASIGDGGMGAIVAYIMALILPTFVVSATSLIIFLTFIAIGEYFFHQYLLKAEKVAP
ncbi:MAG: DUF2512 family protein [Bacillota bacterium]|nr:DUF2512 family protein [Bacillota bacterium]